MYKSILIPTDGSELSQRAVKQGLELAKALGARVTGLYVAPTFHMAVFEDFTPAYGRDKSKFEAAVQKTANKYLDAIARPARDAGVACECIHRDHDYPYEAIIKAAEEMRSDLIVMASHGR